MREILFVSGLLALILVFAVAMSGDNQAQEEKSAQWEKQRQTAIVNAAKTDAERAEIFSGAMNYRYDPACNCAVPK